MHLSDIAMRVRLEQEILTHVRQALCLALDIPFTPHNAEIWLERVTFLFDSFARHLRRLLPIEEEGGYMDHLVDSPRLNVFGRTEQLLAEHQQLRRELRSIHRELYTLRCDNLANLHGLRQRLTGLVRFFEDHCRREAELWCDVYTVDVGGEG